MARLTFERMWNLTEQTFRYSHYLGTKYRQLVGPELMIAVFWEETLFENKPGVGGAVGFGQVQPGTIKKVNHFWEKEDGRPMTFVGSEVLRDDIQSIQLAGLVIAMEYEKLLKVYKQPAGDRTLRVALHNYAGGSSEETDQAAKNAVTARSWFDCRDALSRLHIRGAALSQPTEEFADAIMGGLNKTTRHLGAPKGEPKFEAIWVQQRKILFPQLAP